MNQRSLNRSVPAAAVHGVKSIESLRRGLEVLHTVEQASAITLGNLHRQTRLPKATLLRILKTLQEAGWVERNELEGRYVPRASMGIIGVQDEWRARLSSLAAPLRVALQRRVPWPIDMAVRDGTAMLILDAHLPINGLAVNYRVLGFRPLMLVSSLGRCYLAFCPDDERREIVRLIARSTRSLDRATLRADAVARLVATARAQGYVTRDPSATSKDSPERFGAISTPVFCGDLLVACLSCAWLPTVTSEREIVAAHLADLRGAATAIGERFRRAGVGAPPQA